MSHEFAGFTRGEQKTPDSLYELFRLNEECRRFCFSVIGRLGPRIAAVQWHTGWDQRGGRDYFFENAEVRIRGRKDPSFIGFFHYRLPERFAGSQWQVWEWEHDDDPVVAVPLPVLVAEANEALASGRIGDYLDARAGEIRGELGLQ